MENVYNGEGNHELQAKGRQKFRIKTFETFVVEWKEKGRKVFNIVGPHESTVREYSVVLNNGEKIKITTEGKWTIELIDLPTKGEIADSKSLVEIIPEGEMNMYDKLRAEMLRMFEQRAELHGMESYDEADDLEFEEDDENLINTPYEYQALKDEYLAQRPEDEPYTDEFEKKEENPADQEQKSDTKEEDQEAS